MLVKIEVTHEPIMFSNFCVGVLGTTLVAVAAHAFDIQEEEVGYLWRKKEDAFRNILPLEIDMYIGLELRPADRSGRITKLAGAIEAAARESQHAPLARFFREERYRISFYPGVIHQSGRW